MPIILPDPDRGLESHYAESTGLCFQDATINVIPLCSQGAHNQVGRKNTGEDRYCAASWPFLLLSPCAQRLGIVSSGAEFKRTVTVAAEGSAP